MRGKVWKFGDDISTDLIAPGRYYHLRSNLPELAKHVLEDADADFAANVRPGDFICGGRNFGLGSSREHAPVIIKIAGVGAVIAKSFARIFYRNAVNVGLPVIECDTAAFDRGDELDVDLEKGVIADVTKGTSVTFHPMEQAMRRILEDGGLVEHIKKHGDFSIS
jgi:3-isopropylmalate/(R)-2-methylmalate dehydratase small subunit